MPLLNNLKLPILIVFYIDWFLGLTAGQRYFFLVTTLHPVSVPPNSLLDDEGRIKIGSSHFGFGNFLKRFTDLVEP